MNVKLRKFLTLKHLKNAERSKWIEDHVWKRVLAC